MIPGDAVLEARLQLPSDTWAGYMGNVSSSVQAPRCF